MNWSETNSYLKGIWNKLDELPNPTRVAAFDLDDTIICRPKAKSANNKWSLIDKSIIDKITDLVNNDYIIVIFSNQSGMGSRKDFDKPKWRKAMDDLAKILTSRVDNWQFYFAVYVAKVHDLYRKPNIGMWELMKSDLREEFNLNKIPISKKSFFVGDAAGRISASPFKKRIYPSSSKGDFSDTDRKFALNIGITFLTPEDFLLKDPPKLKFKLEGVNPKELMNNILELESNSEYKFKPRKKEMIIMVGFPGSGKTQFVKKYVKPHGYVHVNQDTCKTKAKCISMVSDAVEKGKSVVIDNTNPDVLTRMAYTSLAKDHGYKHIRAIVMNTDPEIAKHLNNVRHVYSNGLVPKITDIVYNIFKKNYVKPQKSEYFDLIENVDFVLDSDNFDDPMWKKIFLRWSEA